MKEKIAEAVCIATQKTNYRCEHIKSLCENRGVLGFCAYCNVMAEELIANGITIIAHSTEKEGAE